MFRNHFQGISDTTNCHCRLPSENISAACGYEHYIQYQNDGRSTHMPHFGHRFTHEQNCMHTYQQHKPGGSTPVHYKNQVSACTTPFPELADPITIIWAIILLIWCVYGTLLLNDHSFTVSWGETVLFLRCRANYPDRTVKSQPPHTPPTAEEISNPQCYVEFSSLCQF